MIQKKIAIDPKSFSINQLVDANTVGLEHWSKNERKTMKEKGIEAEAEILKVEDTGRSKNFEVEIRIYYRVKALNIKPYKVNGTLFYHPEVAKFIKSKVGSTVLARIYPNDHNKVILRFGNVLVKNVKV